MAEQICAALEVHAEIEEELFYPLAREALKKNGDLIDEAEVEHTTVKELIAKIKQLQRYTDRLMRKAGLDFRPRPDGMCELRVRHSCCADDTFQTVHPTTLRIWSMSWKNTKTLLSF